MLPRSLLSIFLVFLFALTTVEALKLKVEHHGEGHPDHKERGALYRFTLDNYDEENRSKGKKHDLMVRRNLGAWRHASDW